MVPETVGPPQGDLDAPGAVSGGIVLGRHRPVQRHGVVGVVGGTQPDVDIGQHRAGARPVGHVPAHDSVGREDVHEDVLRAALVGQYRVVMHILIAVSYTHLRAHETRHD